MASLMDYATKCVLIPARIVIPALLAAVLAISSGCMNVYNRCPWTDARIERPYQSTREMASWTAVTAFPQMMATDGVFRFSWYNVLSVPVSVIPAADTCLEAVADTVLYPIDRK